MIRIGHFLSFLTVLLLARMGASVEKTAVIEATIPIGTWKGWGLYSQPDPESGANLPAKEEFTVVKTPAGLPRHFSGRVAGLDNYEGATVGLVSMVDVWWISSDKYEWAKVATDGSFAITAQRNPASLKALCVRAPGRPWTFLRYNFKADEGGEKIVLYSEPGKLVRISAAVNNSEQPVSWIRVEPFEAYTAFDDNGNKITKQRYGYVDAQDNDLYLVLPLRKVALYLSAYRAANHYQIIDPTIADHFHFNLLREGRVKLTLLRDGQAVANQRFTLSNDAAPLSVRGGGSNAEGVLEQGNLVPGTYEISVDKKTIRLTVKSGETITGSYDLATGEKVGF